MFFYITVTTECDLKCTYCYGKACSDFGSNFKNIKINYDIPNSIGYDIKDLAKFISRDPSPTLIFYGGEPLLEIDMIKEVMDNIPSADYIVQTNGLHLDKVQENYLKRIHTILVSIDGGERQTDRNRGKGTYKKIIDNLERIRQKGDKGEIIARMTVPVNTNILEEVKRLLYNERYPFTSIHWQLDAQFWEKDYNTPLFKKWIKDFYNPQVKKLIDLWVNHMKNEGTILKIYPFIGIIESLLNKEAEKLRCGAGWIEFNIQTNGIITPCPVMAGMEDFYLGDIYNANPMELSKIKSVTDPCPSCDIYNLCGGRCLYANVTKLWGEEGFNLVCQTVRNLIYHLKQSLYIIQEFLDEGIINIEDFHYIKYNSCEIIP